MFVLLKGNGPDKDLGVIMARTEVTVNYTKSLNMSVTTRDGRIDKVTMWTTGAPASETKRTETLSKRFKM